MPGCPLDTETSSVNVYEVSARIETAARGCRWCSVHLITSCQGMNLAGNESETFQSLLYELLNLAIHVAAPMPNVSIMMVPAAFKFTEDSTAIYSLPWNS